MAAAAAPDAAAAAAGASAAAGAFFGPAVHAITHGRGHSDELIKGATLGFAVDDDDPSSEQPAPKFDVILCESAWYKLTKDGRSPGDVRWRDSFENIHSVEHNLENPLAFEVYYYVGSARHRRSLLCESAPERDDWVVLFRALLTNFFQRFFEKELIPKPGIYQWHLNMTCDDVGSGATVVLLLSTQHVQLLAVPGAPPRAIFKVPAQQVVQIARFAKSPNDVRLSVEDTPGAAPKQYTLRTKDGLEALTTAAEVMRLIKLAGGKGSIDVIE
eukprot:TRINITY_DN60236_c0_g1_i1.p1 TRINITY_DN60236_c0_g1~~TRINITY_DN60236_c0_g1_i1.p1  ORF type:complete len:272 (+),score=69.71 TRINITY_DN60236_c0_g1_i1:61-876(+)